MITVPPTEGEAQESVCTHCGEPDEPGIHELAPYAMPTTVEGETEPLYLHEDCYQRLRAAAPRQGTAGPSATRDVMITPSDGDHDDPAPPAEWQPVRVPTATPAQCGNCRRTVRAVEVVRIYAMWWCTRCHRYVFGPQPFEPGTPEHRQWAEQQRRDIERDRNEAAERDRQAQIEAVAPEPEPVPAAPARRRAGRPKLTERDADYRKRWTVWCADHPDGTPDGTRKAFRLALVKDGLPSVPGEKQLRAILKPPKAD